nr:hypothetical protein [Candidatus Moranbacteria bacterium]
LTRKESLMKLDRTEKGARTSVIGILLMVFVGVMYEDLRHDPSAVAQHWQDITLWLMLLGMAIFIGGFWYRLHHPHVTRK